MQLRGQATGDRQTPRLQWYRMLLATALLTGVLSGDHYSSVRCCLYLYSINKQHEICSNMVMRHTH